MRSCLVLGVALSAAGCIGLFGPESPDMRWADLGRACATDAPAFALSDARRDSIPPFEDDVNGRWADWSLRAPGGWGGYFRSRDGPTMYMLEPDLMDNAAAFLRAEGMDLPTDLVARQGRWSFVDLYDWYRYLLPHALGPGGVSIADVQESRNRLEFSVVDEAARSGLERALQALDVPCYLVAIEAPSPRAEPWGDGG